MIIFCFILFHKSPIKKTKLTGVLSPFLRLLGYFHWRCCLWTGLPSRGTGRRAAARGCPSGSSSAGAFHSSRGSTCDRAPAVSSPLFWLVTEEEEEEDTHTHMKVHRSVWVGGKRTWTSWVVTYAARWPSCIPVCGVVAAHLSPSMSISEISLLCYALLGVWSTLQKKCHLSVCVGCIFVVLASSSLWIPLYSHTLKTIVWACLSLLEQERVVLPLHLSMARQALTPTWNCAMLCVGYKNEICFRCSLIPVWVLLSAFNHLSTT